MKPRILVVSTYPELTKMIRSICDEQGIPVTIHEGGIMKNGHIYAKNMESQFDVIVSQGGTAQVIRNMVNIPVVTIETGTADLLKAMIKAKAYGTKIGLVSNWNETLDELESIKKVLNIDFEIFSYSNKDELKEQIEDVVAKDKLTLVSVGSCIREIAKEKNIHHVVIGNRKSRVKQAILDAKNICDIGKREKESAERIKTIINYSIEGIIALDKDGVITAFNTVAERVLKIKAHEVVGYPISHFINRKGFRSIYGDCTHETGKLVNIEDIKIMVNRIPIVLEEEKVGMVITFQEVSRIQKLEHKVRTQLFAKGLIAKYTFNDVIGNSIPIINTIKKAKKFAKTSTNVLITGETGCGKELFAQSIHNESPRRNGPFVAINCAALPENLLESELFGYEGGAFTGARKGGKAGLFELAHGGTIFLDEIGEMPLKLQSRLLRVLQERQVLRIGGDYIVDVDVRVIAATNLDLYKLVQEGKFREDLYFRIDILNLRLPSLRYRKEDIPLLVKYFVEMMGRKHEIDIEYITQEGMNVLKEYDWPGNVRELQNLVEKMVILTEKPILEEVFLKKLIIEHISHKRKECITNEDTSDTIMVRIGQLKEMELQTIQAISKRVKGDKNLLAQKLGISRTTLWKRLKELEETKVINRNNII